MTSKYGVFKNFLIILVLSFVFFLWTLKSCPDAKKVAMYVSDNVYIATLCCTDIVVLKCFVSTLPTTFCFIIFGYLLPNTGAFLMCMLCVAVLFSESFYKGKEANKLQGNHIIQDKAGIFLTAVSLHCMRFCGCSFTGYFFGKIGAPYLICVVGAILGMIPSIILSLSLSSFLPDGGIRLALIFALALVFVVALYFLFNNKQRKRGG